MSWFAPLLSRGPANVSGRIGSIGLSLLVILTVAVAPVAHADPIFPSPTEPVVAPIQAAGGLGSHVAVTPFRARDTRSGLGGPSGPIATRGTSTVTVQGLGGVPATGVTAVVANVTVTGASGGGYFTVYPAGAARPAASNLNFSAGQTVANLVVIKVGSNGRITIFNGSTGSAHLIVDITGYYGSYVARSVAGSLPNLLRAVTPFRARDTRSGQGGPSGPIATRGTSTVTVQGLGGVPATGVTAVVANVTVTGASGGGYFTVYPAGAARPAASNLNFSAGQTVANLVVIKVGSNGRITIFNGSTGSAHLIVDITGWVGPGEVSSHGGLLAPVTPVRVRDTRSGLGGPSGPIATRGTSTVTVQGLGGVPATGVTAVVANVTVTGASGGGYFTVYPAGAARPAASNLNFSAGQTVANLVVIKVGSNGRITIFNGSTGSAHLIVDITGYYNAGTGSIEPAGRVAATPSHAVIPDAIEVPKNLQRSVQRDLSSLAPDKSGRQTDEGPANRTSATSFPVGDWGYLQTPPDPAVGRIYNVNAAGTITGFCSGTVVARNLVLTAAHCLTSAGYAFAPQQFGTSFPYGVWFASAYIGAAQYNNGANMGADWALLIFNNPDAGGRLIGDRTSYFAISSDPPGGWKYTTGYPSEGWFSTNCDGTAVYGSCYPVYCHSQLTSSAQYYLQATDPAVSYGGWWSQGFGCYMTGGASGGPVFQQIGSSWYVVGVNSYVDFGPTYSQNCGRLTGVCGWYSRNSWAPYLNQVVIDYWFAYRVA